ncbi:MAG TPA: hypothetical protein VFE24_18655 [Pirellulales bacterium]|jgi:aspartokinase-like uncharacterized kinase|nr:hypothetical protein [Pirellulales bacterium]
MRIRVCKFGGSLLTHPAAIERMGRWLAAQPSARTVVLVGGGNAVESLRQQSARGELCDDSAHWRAVAAMGEHARLLQAQIPAGLLARSLAEIAFVPPELGSAESLPAELFFFDPTATLHNEDRRFSAGPLPSTWDVTSDSIAARIAQLLRAAELVLWKSCDLPAGSSLCRWSDGGFVDRYFPQAAAGLRAIRSVNLASAELTESPAAL